MFSHGKRGLRRSRMQARQQRVAKQPWHPNGSRGISNAGSCKLVHRLFSLSPPFPRFSLPSSAGAPLAVGLRGRAGAGCQCSAEPMTHCGAQLHERRGQSRLHKSYDVLTLGQWKTLAFLFFASSQSAGGRRLGLCHWEPANSIWRFPSGGRT